VGLVYLGQPHIENGSDHLFVPSDFEYINENKKGFSYWKYNRTWDLIVIAPYSIDVHFKKDVSVNVHPWRKYIGYMNHLMILLTDYWASFKLMYEQNRYCIWKFPVFWLALETVWTVNKDTEYPRLKETFKGITHGWFYIYINLGILPLCNELWNGTCCMRISWYLCLYS